MSVDISAYFMSGIFVSVSIIFTFLFVRLYFGKSEPIPASFREPEWAEMLNKNAADRDQEKQTTYLLIAVTSLLITFITFPG